MLNKKAIYYFPIIFLAFNFYLPSINACTCIRTKPENVYCSSDWVAIVQVLKATSVTFMDMKYEVDVLQSFKQKSNETSIIGKNEIYTISDEGICGLSELKLDKKYLLAGDINKDGKMSVWLCGQFQFGKELFWENVPSILREKLEMEKFKC